MVAIESAAATRRWRAALFALFSGIGVTFASWVTRTPDIRDAVSASTAQMGLALAGLSVGSLVGITFAGWLITRLGTRRVVAASATAMILGLAVIAVATGTGGVAVVGVGLALYGLGMGATEVGTNVDGAELERLLRTPVLPPLHGCFSIGTFAGALIGLGFNAMAVPVTVHLAAAVAAMVVTAVWTVLGIPSRPGAAAEPAAADGPRPALWRDRTLLLIGVIVLGMAFAEGSANDWLPLITVDGFGASTTAGSLAYALFCLAMAVGRFSGGPIVRALGRVTAIRVTASIAAAGTLVVVLAPNLAVASAGIVLWGLGTSLGFPVALSAAGDDPTRSAARVSAVASIGYLAFLVGPPLLGLLGEHVGLRNAIVVTAVVAVVAAACAPAARPRQPADA